tara:strand:- start:7280 stop:7495 length:216 start_codon:yes stop_codon:yes gene_type:complete
MNANKCLFCGSSRLRADRALSGRLVCTSCGNPYGVKKVRRNQMIKLNYFSLNNKYLIFLVIFLIAFLLVII